jgi:hypothetical protein
VHYVDNKVTDIFDARCKHEATYIFGNPVMLIPLSLCSFSVTNGSVKWRSNHGPMEAANCHMELVNLFAQNSLSANPLIHFALSGYVNYYVK